MQRVREGRERILHPGDDASLRAHMFEEQERPSQLEDAPDLTQAALGSMYGTEDEGGHHTLELCIGEWEGLDRGTSECNGKGRCRERASGLHQHGLVRLNRLHALHAGRRSPAPQQNCALRSPSSRSSRFSQRYGNWLTHFRLLQRKMQLIHSSRESMGVKMAQAIWSLRRSSQLERARNSHPASPRSAASSRELPTKISMASLVNHRGGTNHPVR